jgi:hypothetical protein
MKNKISTFIGLITILIVVTITAGTRAESESSREYQIKAAFLYNFIKFVDWPIEKEDPADGNEPITIGIIGKDPFSNSFEPLEDKQVKGRYVVIKRFVGFEQLNQSDEQGAQQHPEIEAIRKCHVLFICPSEKEYLQQIIASTKDYAVLSVGDMNGFLEAGGIINFLTEEKKIRFEINLDAAGRSKLTIRSKLLRLAKRVIKQDGA